MGTITSFLLRYVLILLIPVSVIVSLNAREILVLLFGSSYADYPNAAISFSLLVISYAFWGMVYAAHTVLRAMGEARFFLAVGLSVILFEIMLCMFLTSFLGLLGAALTRSAYILVLLITALARLHQKGARGLGVLGKSFIRIGLSAAIPGLLVRLIPVSGFLWFIYWLIVALLTYVLLLFLSREVNELDFRLAHSLLPTRTHGFLDRLKRFYLKVG
jgi:O-antigen/teichoic acid export membrane protein